jgi:hypothetical protein
LLVKPYRHIYRERGPRQGLVTIASYLDLIEAELSRARLASEDIDAVVIEPTGFNPLLTGAAGGVRLQVDESDRIRAEEILAQPPPEVDTAADEEDEQGSVRCPRCELAYCSHCRMLPGASYAHPLLILGAVFSPKKWRCARCEHAWDDPNEGPRALTPRLPGDPRPVFRLGRAHPGMGLLLGGTVGLFAMLLLGEALGAKWGHDSGLAVMLVWPAAIAAGWLIGRSLRADYCSEPGCRAEIPPLAETCVKCNGAVAGVIKSASQHYSATADFRRELAALRAADAASRKKRKKGRKAKAAAAHAPDS